MKAMDLKGLCLSFGVLFFLLACQEHGLQKDPGPGGNVEDALLQDASIDDEDAERAGDAGHGEDQDGKLSSDAEGEGELEDTQNFGDAENPPDEDAENETSADDGENDAGDEGSSDSLDADSGEEDGEDGSSEEDIRQGDGEEGPEDCEEGSFLNESGACEAFTPCEPGTYVAGQASAVANWSCKPCAEGFYSDSENSLRCKPFSPCQPGQKILVMGTKTQNQVCETCQMGTFSSEANALNCEELSTCEPGEYVLDDGSRSQDRKCGPCEEGHFSKGNNSPTCEAFSVCPMGTAVSKEGSKKEDRECEPCPLGHFSDSENSVSCQAFRTCEKGSFVSVKGSIRADRSCEACGSGYYSDESNAQSCKPQVVCEKGSHVLELGSAEKAQLCAPCPSGSFSSTRNAETCEAQSVCESGTYIEVPGSPEKDQVCAPCPTGTFSSEEDQESCQPFSHCEAGSFVQEAGSPKSDYQCERCEEGSFSIRRNSPTCYPHALCQKGSHVLKEGTSTENRLCAPCEAGTYSDEENQATCSPFLPCEAGSFVLEAGSRVKPPLCESCDEGYFSEGGFNPSCQRHRDCGYGSFVAEAGSATKDRICEVCEEGSFSKSMNAPSCSPFQVCETGSVILEEGSAIKDRTCGNCDKGLTTYAPNESECVYCEECYAKERIFAPSSESFDEVLKAYNPRFCLPLEEDLEAVLEIQEWEEDLLQYMWAIFRGDISPRDVGAYDESNPFESSDLFEGGFSSHLDPNYDWEGPPKFNLRPTTLHSCEEPVPDRRCLDIPSEEAVFQSEFTRAAYNSALGTFTRAYTLSPATYSMGHPALHDRHILYNSHSRIESTCEQVGRIRGASQLIMGWGYNPSLRGVTSGVYTPALDGEDPDDQSMGFLDYGREESSLMSLHHEPEVVLARAHMAGTAIQAFARNPSLNEEVFPSISNLVFHLAGEAQEPSRDKAKIQRLSTILMTESLLYASAKNFSLVTEYIQMAVGLGVYPDPSIADSEDRALADQILSRALQFVTGRTPSIKSQMLMLIYFMTGIVHPDLDCGEAPHAFFLEKLYDPMSRLLPPDLRPNMDFLPFFLSCIQGEEDFVQFICQEDKVHLGRILGKLDQSLQILSESTYWDSAPSTFSDLAYLKEQAPIVRLALEDYWSCKSQSNANCESKRLACEEERQAFFNSSYPEQFDYFVPCDDYKGMRALLERYPQVATDFPALSDDFRAENNDKLQLYREGLIQIWHGLQACP